MVLNGVTPFTTCFYIYYGSSLFSSCIHLKVQLCTGYHWERIHEDSQDFGGFKRIHVDLQGFMRLWESIHEDSQGFMRLWKRIYEDSWGFMRIRETLGEDL